MYWRDIVKIFDKYGLILIMMIIIIITIRPHLLKILTMCLQYMNVLPSYVMFFFLNCITTVHVMSLKDLNSNVFVYLFAEYLFANLIDDS